MKVDRIPDTVTTVDSLSKEGYTSVQNIVNSYRAYRTPFFESQAQYERAQISLIDEQFGQYLSSQNLPELPQIFDNELQSIDADVRRVQLAYLSTILLSPIDGVVTGVYKNRGDWVRPGEPVVRVENNASCLLVGRVIYRGRISNNSDVTIFTKLFDHPGASRTKIVGQIVAARGQDDDDNWEIVVQVPKNQNSAGDYLLPLGYHFDYDNTTMGIGS
jgi:multidrug efflux pump subunit AcrA (membrane-fusion protein)